MSEENIGEDVQLVEGDAPKNMQVAVIGADDNPLARATYSAFVVPRGVDVNLYSADRIDDCLESNQTSCFGVTQLVSRRMTQWMMVSFVSIQKLVRAVVRVSVSFDYHH